MVRITRDVYMVGSGQLGLSNALDCHVYLLDGGEALALIDAGGGRKPERTHAGKDRSWCKRPRCRTGPRPIGPISSL